jgi:hypothetical protein
MYPELPFHVVILNLNREQKYTRLGRKYHEWRIIVEKSLLIYEGYLKWRLRNQR